MGYIKGEPRGKRTLFPKSLEDVIEEDSEVRVIEKFIEALNLKKMGFTRTKIVRKGRKAYSPNILLKLHLYGYYNRIRSSRRLEKECKRNIEVMWLINKLQPSHQVISKFRKNNRDGIKKVFLKLNEMLYSEGLIGKKGVSIDGSRFKANTNTRNVQSKKTLKREMKNVKNKINKYLEILKKNEEKEEEEICEENGKRIKKSQIKKVLEYLNKKKENFEEMQEELENSEENQVSKIDKDCKLLTKNGITIAGYNVQIAVDNKNNFIVGNQVSRKGNDKKLLYKMGILAKKRLRVNTLILLADKGYFSRKNIKKCEEEGIKPYIPKENPNSSSSEYYSKNDFEYDENKDVFICPAGKKLKWYRKFKSNGIIHDQYRCNEIDNCELRDKCSNAKNGRTIIRWEEEERIEEMEETLIRNPELMRIRGSTVEHVFGTIKRNYGYRYFLLEGLGGTQTEFDLMSIAHNLKRAINIVGIKGIIGKIEKYFLLLLKKLKFLLNFGFSTIYT